MLAAPAAVAVRASASANASAHEPRSGQQAPFVWASRRAALDASARCQPAAVAIAAPAVGAVAEMASLAPTVTAVSWASWAVRPAYDCWANADPANPPTSAAWQLGWA